MDETRVKAFNLAIGYRKAHQKERVAMDFAIVAAWDPICRALLQDPIQGDVLNLVHLSNAYEIGSDTRTVQMGEVLDLNAYVNSVTIDESGKTVKVVCDIRRGRSCPRIISVTSRFLFRGIYFDYPSTFAHTVEKPYGLKLSTEIDVAVLASRSWFQLDDQNSLNDLDLTKLTLEFQLTTFSKWKAKGIYSSLETTGKVFVRSDAGDLTPIASVKHRASDCRNNAVLSFLQRRAEVLNEHKLHALPPTEAGVIVADIRIPASNEPYSRASGDYNPIHTSPLFATMAHLPGTITHGMYCSAAVRQVVERLAAGQNPDRIRKYEVSFVGMVLPNDILEVTLRHNAMQSGVKHVNIEVRNKSTEEKVLMGSAHISQPATTVVFTGQGSQEKGMGMDLYASSPVARSIWDRADTYFLSQFGLSILDVIRDNPKEVKVHFGGIRGRMLRQNYLSMYYETPSKPGGKPERRPIFPDISETSTSFTHSSPKGLLFATQFAQPALTIMELAAFKDMQANGVVADDCHFAGHSLGEYAALASITDFMPFENLLYLVFCRGMTMQGAVERDTEGRSSFSMVAVDPSRIRKGTKSCTQYGEE